jgi:membrane associated rhomboid family serine protease
MKEFIKKLQIPFIILLTVNIIGFLFHINYEGAVVGSAVGMVIGMVINEIKIRL